MKCHRLKTLTAVLLTVTMLLTMCPVFSVTVVPETAQAVTLKEQVYRDGDANGDGKVDTADVRYLLTLLVKNVELTEDQTEAADATNDQTVNTADAKYILTRSMTTEAFNTTTVDLLAPTVDDWYNCVMSQNNAHAIVSETALSGGGYEFENVSTGGFTWPYAVYVYDNKVLLPEDAVIEYDLTVGGSSTSVNLYLGGALPSMDGDTTLDGKDGQHYVKLNKLISSKNIDAGSGDLTTGTYKGTIKVSDLAVEDCSRVAGMIWVSAIKLYSVGNKGTKLTVRKLQVTAYKDVVEADYATDPTQMVRPGLMNRSETAGLSTVTGIELFVNGSRSEESAVDKADDNKKIYNTVTKQRVINYADGYQIDMPYDWEADYELSALRSRYTSEHYSLTVTKETKNPYSGYDGWNTYLTEWLNRYIADSTYLSNNGLSYTRTPLNSDTLLSGYTVMTYDLEFKDKTNLDMPYYSIVIIRKHYTYNTFYLMVLKSDTPTASVADNLWRSFKEVTAIGKPANVQGQYEVKIPANWSDETKAYYEKLQTQTTTDFGFFSYSMVPKSDSSYTTQNSRIKSEYKRLSQAMGYEYAIMPTYTHLKYGSSYNQFPTDMANTYAGGNGFNGKPVLQFTYQYTTNNNSSMYAKNPVFEVIRGNHDAQFRKLAKDIKAYGKPVLFRLNNEMNTDWTSYSGIVSLLDPDLFIQSWQRLYDIFEEEGVNNCIWIFNPIAKSTPYCNWGEDLCYMPGADYVQILGLTNYEMGNGTSLKSFRDLYTEVYDKSYQYFADYPWVISEFAAGAGGEVAYDWSTDAWTNTVLGRNEEKQAAWVKAMFNCLNNKGFPVNAFAKNIVGAVWFSCNDYATVNNSSKISNYLALDASLDQTLDAFKAGFAAAT